MFEAVTAAPEGASTVARFARTADRCGYEGIVVRNAPATEYDPDAVAERWGVDVVDAVEVDAARPSSASGHVGNQRPDRTVVCVRGGTDELNRFAVESDRVDVLATPTDGDASFDDVLAKAAAEHGVRIEFDLGPVLRATGGKRVRALQSLRQVREIVDAYDAPYVVSARARSHLQLRAPRELAALGEVVGLGEERVREGLREWGRLAERNRHRHSESFIEPGVERGGMKKTKDEHAERFDEKADEYDESRHDVHYTLAELVTGYADPDDDDVVLDLGAGTGAIGLALAEDADRVVLRDISEGMLEQAREKVAERDLTNVEVGHGSFREPAVDEYRSGDGSEFDVVVSSMAMHHLDDAAKREAIDVVAALDPDRFVLGDVMLFADPDPDEPAYDPSVDDPSTVGHLVDCLTDHFVVTAVERVGDPVGVLVAERPTAVGEDDGTE